MVLTAYDLPRALVAAAGGVDALLVGDSLGMVVLGHDTTLPVTIDEMMPPLPRGDAAPAPGCR